MAIKIYWGPPGSYKSSSAVMDVIGACAAEGRHVITNVRGLSESKIREHAPKCHKDFALTHLRMDVPEDLDKLRRWWHWAPTGSYFVLDEVQAIYPPDWSAKQLHELDLPSDQERVINGNNFPKTVALAFDMHRHGNWDFCFTTPNIKKVLPAIRGAAETAYKHKNLAILGIKRRFVQFMHLAEDNGNTSDMYGSRWRRIPQWVFQCYESTATGAVSDSRAGWSIFANGKLLFLFGVMGLVLVWLLSHDAPTFLRNEQPPTSRPLPPSGQTFPLVGELPVSSNASSPALVSSAQRPSSAWRVAMVFEASREAGMGYAVLESQSYSRRVPLDMCKRSWATGWSCKLDGEIVTESSGMRPSTSSGNAKADLPKVQTSS